MNRTSWTDRADRVRRLPLAPLAAALGYVPDPRQRTRWKRDGSRLSLRGDRFYDHLRQRGGGGAVDLVMHAVECHSMPVKQSVFWRDYLEEFSSLSD